MIYNNKVHFNDHNYYDASNKAFKATLLVIIYDTFIVQVSIITIIDYDNTFIVQATGHPGPNVIKLFTSAIYVFSLKAGVFLHAKPFQPSLMFVGKARSVR
jgi:hypothetical protein